LNATLNVGLSHGAVSITGNGLLILSVLMVVGRLLPVLVVMSWVSDANRKV
jgi:Trk-type K+ transport system membrane component